MEVNYGLYSENLFELGVKFMFVTGRKEITLPKVSKELYYLNAEGKNVIV